MTDQHDSGTVDAAQLLQGFWMTAVAHALARLNIPDALAEATRTSGELATELELHRGSLFRLLRAAAALGLARHHGARQIVKQGVQMVVKQR